LTRDDVFELLDGQCRLLAPLTEELAGTAARWARAVVPIADELAGELLKAEREQNAGATQARALGNGQATSSKRPRRARRVVMREYRERIAPEADPRRGPAAGAKRRAAMATVVAANRAWAGDAINSAEFRRTILPHLAALKLADLMAATGLTKGACSRIRAGRVLPHPRHWQALETMARGPRYFAETD
jgi:hypothetical protein